jgi:hypothetical protein
MRPLRQTILQALLGVAFPLGRLHVAIARPLRAAIGGEWRWWMALTAPVLLAAWALTRIILIWLIGASISLART